MGTAAAEAAGAVIDDENLERRATEIRQSRQIVVLHIQSASSRGAELQFWII